VRPALHDPRVACDLAGEGVKSDGVVFVALICEEPSRLPVACRALRR
jgi:hypothetical protein